MKNYALHIPEGVKDYTNEEAALKEQIQNIFKKVFKTNNYSLVETPTFEYLDVFALGEQSYQQPSLYHLVNRQGELMALRSDMTRSIARLIGTHQYEVFPKRFSYLCNCFRYPERYQGKLHEFTQAGIELIGNKSMNADAEVIKIAIQCLKEAGVSDFNVHIGSSRFLNHLFNDLGFKEEKTLEIFEAIEAKDAVRLKAIFMGEEIERETLELLLELIQCSGQIGLLRHVKSKLHSSKAIQELEQMEQLYELLEDYGVNESITFDFSLMSYGKYYTGMMFQIFTLGVGSALIEGGRYDKLLQQFGKDLPAVGFGIHINRVMQRLIKQKSLEQRQSIKALAVCKTITRKVCHEVCDHLRNRGMIIENFLQEEAMEEAIAYAKQAGFNQIFNFKHGDIIEVYAVQEGKKYETTVNEL